MKNFFAWSVTPGANEYSDTPQFIYIPIDTSLATVSLFILILLLTFLKCSEIAGTITFLYLEGASVAAGAAIGFLFVLHGSEKLRFINKDGLGRLICDSSWIG